MSSVHFCKWVHSSITLLWTPKAAQCAGTARWIRSFFSISSADFVRNIFFSSIKYLPIYGSNNHRNVCGSSSYMSVILSDFNKNCNGWTNFLAISNFNLLTPNDNYSGRTAPLTSKCCILYIYSTNIGTDYFKHGMHSPFFPLQNAVCFIILTYLVPVLFTFYIQDVLKFKK